MNRHTVIQCNIRDVSARKQAEARVAHLNSVLQAIRNVNQLIVHEKDRERLLQQACATLAETRGFRSVWIVRLGEDGRVAATAEWGLGPAFAGLRAQLDRGALPQCCQRALASDEPVVLASPAANCPACSLAGEYRDKAAIAARLCYAGRTYGVLIVAVPADMAADAEEVSLFDEVAGDLAFALHDIELAEARRTAEERIELLARFPSENPNPVLGLSGDGVILYANAGSAALLRAWSVSTGQPAPESWRARVREALAEGKSRIVEAEAEGLVFSLEIVPITGAGHANLYGRDVTERKRAEEALRRQTERLRNLRKTDQAILQALESPEAIVQTALQHLPGLLQCRRVSVGIFDLEKKEVRVFAAEVNGETIVQTGKVLAEEAYGDLEILRQDRMEIVEDLSGVTSPSAVARILQAEGMRSSINVPFLSGRGLIGALNVGWGDPRAITPEDTEIAGEVAGQITLAIEQARLLQEAKRHAAELEQRVRDRTARLEEVNKELEAFSYSVSHDLRAPLRAIDGFARILVDDYAPHLNTEGKRVCSIIRDNTAGIGRVIDDLLAFSRLGRAEMQPSRIDMGAMANSMFHELTTPESRERIDFQVGSLPAAVGDPSLMRQVWTNLLGNAVKFSSKRERAVSKVSGELREGESVYAVQDNGAGFDMRYVDKLFGVFQRLHSTTEFEGTGVGLALVQRVIRRHGGRVWAEGETDRGATFYFALPQRGA